MIYDRTFKNCSTVDGKVKIYQQTSCRLYEVMCYSNYTRLVVRVIFSTGIRFWFGRYEDLIVGPVLVCNGLPHPVSQMNQKLS